MELSDYKRFSVNDNLWFSIQPDKMIFGGDFLPKNMHCTLSYGLKSGFLDFHIRKDLPGNVKIYFPVVKISTKDLYENLDFFKWRLLVAFLIGLEEISFDWIKKNSIGFIPLLGMQASKDDTFFNEVLSELLISPTKRKLAINYKNESFIVKAQSLGEKYAEKWKEIVLNPQRILEMDFGTGVIITKNKRRYFIKFGSGENYQIYLFDSLDLDHIRILRKFLGNELYQILASRYNEGLETLRQLVEPKEFEDYILTLKKENNDNA